jgi:hypothetical protein
MNIFLLSSRVKSSELRLTQDQLIFQSSYIRHSYSAHFFSSRYWVQLRNESILSRSRVLSFSCSPGAVPADASDWWALPAGPHQLRRAAGAVRPGVAVHGHGDYGCVWCSPAGHSSGMPAGPWIWLLYVVKHARELLEQMTKGKQSSKTRYTCCF